MIANIQNYPGFVINHLLPQRAAYYGDAVISQVGTQELPVPCIVSLRAEHQVLRPGFQFEAEMSTVKKVGVHMQLLESPGNAGIRFTGYVSDVIGPGNGTPGSWHLAQTVDALFERSFGTPAVQQSATYGSFEYKCDSRYPYGFAPPAPGIPGDEYIPADGNKYEGNDSPAIAWTNGTHWLTMVHTFRMYQMYTPPNSPENVGVSPVPLREIEWWPRGMASESGASFTVQDLGSSSVVLDNPMHPTWDETADFSVPPDWE